MNIREIDGLTVIGESEQGTLYHFVGDDIDTVFFVDAQGAEWCLGDWQGARPASMDEIADYDWYPLADINEWHS